MLDAGFAFASQSPGLDGFGMRPLGVCKLNTVAGYGRIPLLLICDGNRQVRGAGEVMNEKDNFDGGLYC